MTVSPEGRINALLGALVFLTSFLVYAYCVTPTVPYWDSGEFIATSYRLGIPHPPGTPLYVLIGRLFSLLPLGAIAVRVNLLSSFGASVAVLFTYLIAVRLIRKNEPDSGWLAPAGGLVAAFFTAWGTTFWDNAVEAEVYSSSSALMCLCVWLALWWWDRQDEPQNDRFLWLILYVLFLAIGIHLGTFLVFPCIYLLVTMVHWRRVKKGWFWSSIGLFLVAQFIRLLIIMQAHRDYDITELSMAPESVKSGVGFTTLLMGAAILWNLVSVLGLRFTAGIGALAILGVSVHLYLLIRAGLNPSINEADPSNLKNLLLVLSRDQYKPPEPIFRKASFGYQFTVMYLRYFNWQFELFKSPGGLTALLPIMIGLWGAIQNAWREKKSFFLMLTLFLITGPFMVWYLNFKEGEVRDRDYFFVANFHFFSIWIGLGAAALLRLVADALAREGRPALRHPAVVGLAGLLVVMSVLPMAAGQENENFFRHNRRGNYVAHGYGYNMLIGLEPNALLFTNGDNDTFPLWYVQEVENVRKDVRVINLSLLQTDWYIRQLRDREPRVPMKLTDGQILGLQPYRERDGRIVFVNDWMVKHILEVNQWKRPVYLAVTVPDQRGLDRQLKMEGLVFRIYKDPVNNQFDVVKLDENLNHKYHYRGFLTPTGEYDTSVYKDDQATRLLQNYAAGRLRLAAGLHQQGNDVQARAELEKIQKYARYFPGVDAALGVTFAQMGMAGEARAYYEKVLAQNPRDVGALAVLGHLKLVGRDTAGAEPLLKKCIEISPAGDFNPYTDLATIYQRRGDFDSLVNLLQQWLRYHPEDTRVRNFLDALMGRTPPPGEGP